MVLLNILFCVFPVIIAVYCFLWTFSITSSGTFQVKSRTITVLFLHFIMWHINVIYAKCPLPKKNNKLLENLFAAQATFSSVINDQSSVLSPARPYFSFWYAKFLQKRRRGECVHVRVCAWHYMRLRTWFLIAYLIAQNGNGTKGQHSAAKSILFLLTPARLKINWNQISDSFRRSEERSCRSE